MPKQGVVEQPVIGSPLQGRRYSGCELLATSLPRRSPNLKKKVTSNYVYLLDLVVLKHIKPWKVKFDKAQFVNSDLIGQNLMKLSR
ncbi:hypothetical protein M0804_007031 [Polistes exclamans]|nr:hypothetical protein M0804_007031 [Polistes exclamans]